MMPWSGPLLRAGAVMTTGNGAGALSGFRENARKPRVLEPKCDILDSHSGKMSAKPWDKGFGLLSASQGIR